MRLSILAAASLFALAGCQEEMMSNGSIQNQVAMRLGVPTQDVVISNRQTASATDTYVVAHVRGEGVYRCRINGGGLLAMGLTNAAECDRLHHARVAED